jgi:hypothetical protein
MISKKLCKNSKNISDSRKPAAIFNDKLLDFYNDSRFFASFVMSGLLFAVFGN